MKKNKGRFNESIAQQVLEIRVNYREQVTNLLNDTQKNSQCHSHNTGLIESLLKALCEAKPVQDICTENQMVLIEHLRGQILAVNRLVQALDSHSKTPIRLRTYPPQLVSSLIYQTEMLTDTLSSLVIPRLAQIGNNKK